MKTLITLFIATQVFASVAKISTFKQSLASRYLLNPNHLDQVASKITIRKPNGFERWQMNRTGAEATYNDKTNTIVLRKAYWVGNRLKGHKDFTNGTQFFDVKTTTTLHELSHADYDVYIGRTNSGMNDLLTRKLIPWFRKNFPRFNSKIATHELFGYTAGDSVQNLTNEISTILMNHGLHFYQKKCFGEVGLKKIAKRLGMTKDNIEFKLIGEDFDYYDKAVPQFTYVKGKALDLRKTPLPEQYKRDLYDYFVSQYDFPATRSELVEKLNKSHYAKYLKECMDKVL